MSYKQDLKYITSVYARIKADPSCEFSVDDYEAWRTCFNRAVAVHNKRTRVLKSVVPLVYCFLSAFLLSCAFRLFTIVILAV